MIFLLLELLYGWMNKVISVCSLVVSQGKLHGKGTTCLQKQPNCTYQFTYLPRITSSDNCFQKTNIYVESLECGHGVHLMCEHLKTLFQTPTWLNNVSCMLLQEESNMGEVTKVTYANWQ